MNLATLNDIKKYNKKLNIDVSLLYKEHLTETEWGKLYIANSDVIDGIAYKLYGSYVLEDVENPLKTNNTSELLTGLQFNTDMFIQAYKTSINKLWELESINFSPIENYDRYEEATVNKSGNETDNTIKSGSKINTSTSNGSVSNESKINQTETNTVEPTSYNTNLVDTSKTSYSGDADTSKTTYDNLVNDNKEVYNNITENNTRTYNDVKDTTESHIHGNIGVTTATAMMKEYVDFYSTYNFWLKFWELYVHINCRADFNNIVEL